MQKRTLLGAIVAATATLALSTGTWAADVLPGKIIIGGASGGLGGETVDALLARGVKPSDLILVSRTPDKLAAYAAKGAVVRKGDYNDPASLPAAFAGGDRLLIISTNGGGDRKVQHQAAIDAAKKAGVKLIAYTSYVKNDQGQPADGLAVDHRATEEMLKKSGVAYVILGNSLYNVGLIGQGAEAIARGEIVSNAGEGKWAPVARKDCAAAAAAVLSTPGHDNKFYNITGPDLISNADFARLLTEVTGKPVKYVSLDDAAFIERLKATGMPEAVARRVASFSVATREGQIAVKTTAVRDLTGREPQSVRALLEENKARLLAPPTTMR
jgi:NAD(P)H dehydrogenase (quinone)